MKETSYLSVVLTIQEASNEMLAYVTSLHDVLSQQFVHYEVILVCNGPAARPNEAQQNALQKHEHTTILLQLAHRHSLEVAGYVGLEYTKGDFVLEIEYPSATFSEAIMPRLFAESAKGYDIVSVIHKERSSFFSKLFYGLLRRTSLMPVAIGTESMRLVTRRTLNTLFTLKQKVKYRKLFYAYTGFQRTVIEVDEPTPSDRPYEQTHRFERLNLAVDVLLSYTTIVVRLTLILALLFLALSVFGGVYSVFVYFVKDVRVEGWTTLMLFVALGFSGVFMILSMIVKYLELIIRETQSTPLYVVESVDVLSHNTTHPHV